MHKIKLSKFEQQIEAEIGRGEWKQAPQQMYDDIAVLLAQRRKDSVLNLRVNSQDLKAIKEKARKMGVKYQTFISEILHRVATS